jgi:hypothetical protein
MKEPGSFLIEYRHEGSQVLNQAISRPNEQRILAGTSTFEHEQSISTGEKRVHAALMVWVNFRRDWGNQRMVFKKKGK